VGFTEKSDIFHVFHPADHGDNAEQQDIHQIMLFAAVDPGVRYLSKFGSYVHYSPPPFPGRLFSLFLEGFYNAVALTCFAALLEVAYEIRNAAGWLVGSEGVIPSNGWDYTAVFTRFFQNPGLTADDFCQAAVTEFSTQYGGVSGATISQIKLSEVNALFTAFEAFAETLALNITTTAVRDTVLAPLLTTVEGYYFTSFPSDLYVDIFDFSQTMIAMRTTITSDPVQQNAISTGGTVLQTMLQNAVPNSWAKNGTTRKLGVHVIPLQAVAVPRASHEGEYIKGSMYLGKSAFVESSNHWVPNAVPQAGSFLDKLFYYY
jgi:hypothetical protein